MTHLTVPFPAALDARSTEELLEVFEAGPGRVDEAVRGLTQRELQARPIPGKWSILEIALHLVDSELGASMRFRFVWSQPGVSLPFYDQDAWTRELGHGQRGPRELEAALELFRGLRADTSGHLRRASPEVWEQAGLHYEFGRVTLRNLLELYADHSERHVAQIVERRALLGTPLDLPPLLPRLDY